MAMLLPALNAPRDVGDRLLKAGAAAIHFIQRFSPFGSGKSRNLRRGQAWRVAGRFHDQRLDAPHQFVVVHCAVPTPALLNSAAVISGSAMTRGVVENWST